DFKAHPGGYMSFFLSGSFFVLDSTFQIIDQISCSFAGTDVHDLIIDENQHYFIICLEDSTMDLSHLQTASGVPGSSSATVTAGVIRELDPAQNLVKQWSGFDHYTPEDSDSLFFVNPNVMDLNHTNSIALNDQGQMLISQRSNNEIILIDWDSGHVIWRLGGTQNDFALAPADVFSAQHDARFLPDGRISLFDNATYGPSPDARAQIFDLDTVSMTATVDQTYSISGLQSNSMGSYRVAANGQHVINWGNYFPNTFSNISILDASQTPILDIDLDDDFYTYRAQCTPLDFDPKRPRLTCTEQSGQITLGLDSTFSEYLWTNGPTTSTITISDTGRYQVFVPRGIGQIGSHVLHVTDLADGCLVTNSPSAQIPRQNPPKVIGYFDLLGRPLKKIQPGILYFERYEDGSAKKMMRR
ncbi:MAG: arylsulfotransferase family protein, partial [Bacteroidota bacterium]